MQKKNKTNKYCDYKNLQAFLKINSLQGQLLQEVCKHFKTQ